MVANLFTCYDAGPFLQGQARCRLGVAEEGIAAKNARGKLRFGVHPGVTMMQKWVAELPEKTGRTLEEWIAFVKKGGPPTEQVRRAWLEGRGAD